MATDQVWNDYIAMSVPSSIFIIVSLKCQKNNRKAKKWRNKPFPLYEELYILVHGVVATGASAFHPGRSPSPSGDTDQSSDDESDPVSSLSTTSVQSILSDELTQEISNSSQVCTLFQD